MLDNRASVSFDDRHHFVKIHARRISTGEGVQNAIHNKWLSFGGGFYGVVGLPTYVVVELGGIREFIPQFDGFLSLISDITLELFIGFFINSLMNFVVAIAWPVYWMRDIRSDYIWVWFVAAYAGYWAGTRFALRQASTPSR